MSMMSEEVKQKKSKECKVEKLPETSEEKRALQTNGKPALCAFRPSCPTGSSGGVFRWFYKVLGLPGASGRGLKRSSLARLSLDDFWGRFGAHLGPILELILGAIFEGIDGRACNIIMKMILLSYDVRTKQ